ncbi:hypothetical protein BT96DRAFT_1005999 [Gymnopus androsaceus JB14]|uniref:Uncharacterized protein n=1 Tax=Gymnopus androsaceus JB14 TaxID=1447944 RepID=A0A6A4GL99_9AGAR|nr:hypothetical protein BT96DRAFT_1005999 [Gymnopus androsaceus JB14]
MDDMAIFNGEGDTSAWLSCFDKRYKTKSNSQRRKKFEKFVEGPVKSWLVGLGCIGAEWVTTRELFVAYWIDGIQGPVFKNKCGHLESSRYNPVFVNSVATKPVPSPPAPPPEPSSAHPIFSLMVSTAILDQRGVYDKAFLQFSGAIDKEKIFRVIWDAVYEAGRQSTDTSIKPLEGKLADFARPIAREQEEIIRSHLQHIANSKEDNEAPIAQPIASSSQQHTPAPLQSPAPKREPSPPTPPQPSPQDTAPQFPYSNTEPPSPHRSPEPSDPRSPSALIADSNNGNNMSKALKAFDKVTTLKSDRSNWDTWKTRVEFAARSIGYQHYLEWNPQPDLAQGSDDEHRGKDSDLLNAIIGRLLDGIS